MTDVAATGASTPPVVSQALEPAWVRRGTKATQQDYATALAFEKVLTEELTKSLAATSGVEGEGESAEGGASDPGASQLSSLFPQALSTGIANAGGLGLAAQLTHAMEGVRPAGHASASGGTAA